MSIYKKDKVFRTWTGNLDLIVSKYNWVQVRARVRARVRVNHLN